jgi:uncharacterized protein
MVYLLEVWHFLLITAPFFLVGLVLSGLLFGLVSLDRLRHFIGGEKFSGVIKASLIGIPLPLCSCSVIPAALTLKKARAGNGATSSFLIATPETGADSVLMSYAMMDLPMTIIRPLAAFISAVVAGLGQIFFNPDPQAKGVAAQESVPVVFKRKSIKEMLRFSFVDLLDDMALWLAIGVLVGAGIQIFVPDEFLLGSEGFFSRLIILALCLPIYVCASATTPLVASLIMKGMSPGVGLLILLAGPAVNLSNILVLQKHLGKKAVIINIAAISLVALILSYAVDFLYASFQWPIMFNLITHTHGPGEEAAWWEIVSAAIMAILLLYSIVKTQIWSRFQSHGHHHHHHDHNDEKSCCDHDHHHHH